MKTKILHRVLSLLLLLCLVLGTVPMVPAGAAEVSEDTYVVYETNGGVLHIQKDDGLIIYASQNLQGDLVIPEEVQGITVTGILYNHTTSAYRDEIISDAFYGRSGLTSVSIPGTIEEIVPYTFDNCNNLKKVVLNEGVKSLAGGFAGCPVEEVAIPDSLEILGERFTASTNILFQISAAQPNFSVDGQGFVYNKDKTMLLIAGGDRTRSTYPFANTVTEIGAGTFAGNKALESIILSNKIEAIGYGAFADCINLKTVTISADYAFLDNNAFHGCTSLVKIDLPQKKLNTGSYVFQECTGLENIILPAEGVLGNACFYGAGLKQVTIPKNMDVSGSQIFSGCTELETVVFEDGFDGNVGQGMFKDCTNLKSLTAPETFPALPYWFTFFTDMQDAFGRNAPEDLMIFGPAGSEIGRYANTNGIDFTSTGEVTIPFTDTAHWAKGAIEWSYYNYIISGVTPTSFSPNTSITRGMFAAILQRFDGSTLTNSYAHPFTDIKVDSYYFYPVVWAHHNGIVNGTGTNAYSPSDKIKRQDIAVMLYNYHARFGADMSKKADLSDFTDASLISGYAKTAMEWAVANNIMVGYNRELNPQGSATRAETVVMLQKCIGLLESRQLFAGLSPDKVTSVRIEAHDYDNINGHTAKSYLQIDADTLKELCDDLNTITYKKEINGRGVNNSVMKFPSVVIRLSYLTEKGIMTETYNICYSKIATVNSWANYIAPELEANKAFVDKWFNLASINGIS